MEGGAEAEDTPRMEINDLHVSRVSSQSSQTGAVRQTRGMDHLSAPN